MNIFNLNFYVLLQQLLPNAWRRSILFAYMYVCLQQVIRLRARFAANRDENIYRISNNGQVFSLENVLNTRFDVDDRRIYITDGQSNDRYYIFKRIENKTQYLRKFLYNRADYANTGVDFIVWVPVDVFVSPEELIEMRALINKYKLDPKRYIIYRV